MYSSLQRGGAKQPSVQARQENEYNVAIHKKSSKASFEEVCVCVCVYVCVCVCVCVCVHPL